MNETATTDEKQARREARQLFDQARMAAEAGDYRTLRRLDRRVVGLAPSSDVGRQAATELQHLSIDRMGIYVGLTALALYLLAWALALS